EALNDRREHADLRQILWTRIFLVTALLAERGDQVLIVGQILEKTDIAVDSDLQREDASWEKNGRHERDDRELARYIHLHPFRRTSRIPHLTSVCLCHVL